MIRKRQKPLKLRVTFPNGKVICYAIVERTLIETLKEIGSENFRKINLEVGHLPLISEISYSRYGYSMKPICDGWYINTQSDTRQKYMQLHSINQQLGLNLKIEMGAGFETQSFKSSHVKNRKQLYTITFTDGFSMTLDAQSCFVLVVARIGRDRIKKNNFSIGNQKIITSTQQYDNQKHIMDNVWITYPIIKADLIKWLTILTSVMNFEVDVTDEFTNKTYHLPLKSKTIVLPNKPVLEKSDHIDGTIVDETKETVNIKTDDQSLSVSDMAKTDDLQEGTSKHNYTVDYTTRPDIINEDLIEVSIKTEQKKDQKIKSKSDYKRQCIMYQNKYYCINDRVIHYNKGGGYITDISKDGYLFVEFFNGESAYVPPSILYVIKSKRKKDDEIRVKEFGINKNQKSDKIKDKIKEKPFASGYNKPRHHKMRHAKIGDWILWYPTNQKGQVIEFKPIGSLRKLVLRLIDGTTWEVLDNTNAYDIL